MGSSQAQKHSREVDMGKLPNNEKYFDYQVQKMAQGSKDMKTVDPSRKGRVKLNMSPFGGLLVEEDHPVSTLSPIRTMLTNFLRVLDYRTYRLRN